MGYGGEICLLALFNIQFLFCFAIFSHLDAIVLSFVLRCLADGSHLKYYNKIRGPATCCKVQHVIGVNYNI